MSARLVLQFLGLPQIHLGDTPVAADRRKAVALLAYLAVNDVEHQRQRYSRESLSTLFWPDYDQSKAFSNLRRVIWEVHQAIGESWLIADRESVQLNPEAEIDLDLARFKDLLSRSRPQNDAALRISLLTDAVSLYRNHFLTGFSLKDAPNFNEWAFIESEELKHELADALTMLVESHRALKQAESAIPPARRLIALDPLNESAHRQLMEVYIQAGQHSAALKQYQTCEQILRKELDLDPQPETRALYKKIRKGDVKPVEVKEQTGTVTPEHNLPAQLSMFIGRDKEQDEIIHLIAKNRLVTLAGVGGIGKTRLALQVGERLLNDYRNGVWFVALESLSDPAMVPQTVASVFDIREGSDRPVIEILINVLRKKTTLLIFDNCEHLLDACAQLIRSLLTNCPNLKVLATSREILTVAGEASYYVPSLSIPERDNASAENLNDYASIQLFVERATLAASSFRLTKDNAQTVVDICRRVDGIPLAIELAAARVNILQVQEILKQLQNSFALLSSYGRITLPRQQTLQASMDWSWGLLSEAEQIFLRQLSVFSGSWTLETAQAVCYRDVLNLTSTLANKSLIAVNQGADRETRYRFHEIVRQYARQKLVESGEEAHIQTRHLKYFLQLSEQAETALRGFMQVEWYKRLNDERDNIRAALEWADQTDVEAGLYLSARFDWENLDLREGARWLAGFLDKPESKSHPLARAKALCTWAWLLLWLQEFDQNQLAAQECLDLYRACGDKFGEIDGLLALGGIKHNLEALALSQAIGAETRQAQALVNLAWYDTDYHRRVRYMEKAIILFKKLGGLEAAVLSMTWLGSFEIANGNLQTAQKWVDEVMRTSQNLNNKNMKSEILVLFGNMALIKGDYEKARTDLEEASSIAEELGNRWGRLWSDVRLGYVALHEGNLPEARGIFANTAQMFQKDQFKEGVVYTLEGIASLNNLAGKPDRAACLIGWADAMRKQIDNCRPLLEQADVDKIISACLAKMGEVAFSDVYDEGQKMTLDEAVAYALEEHN